jgi:hypothetical protein
MRVLSNAHGLSQFAGPGAWNDLDMLQASAEGRKQEYGKRGMALQPLRS